jgi:ribosomal protein S14
MLSKKIKDIKNRNFFNKKEKNILIKKIVTKFFLAKMHTKSISFLVKTKLNRQNTKNLKIVRRGILDNRNRSILRNLKGLSRISAKELIVLGIIPGYSKSIW